MSEDNWEAGCTHWTGIGCLLLLYNWFSFNAGSNAYFTESNQLSMTILFNTTLGACGGAVANLVVALLWRGYHKNIRWQWHFSMRCATVCTAYRNSTGIRTRRPTVRWCSYAGTSSLASWQGWLRSPARREWRTRLGRF
jgi:hypothetical protein